MSKEPSEKSEKLQRIYEMEGRNTSSTDPKMMESRLFIGNLASDLVGRQDIEKLFGKYGKILGVSLHKSFGFVQFDNKESANEAVKEEKGKSLKGLKMDLCIATERRKDPVPGMRGRRPPRSRSHSPRRRREREWERERDRDRWGWGFDRRPSPPRYRGPLDPYRDPYYPPRDDPYYRPRDDPFERYPPPDPYDRYPPSRGGYPRDYPPPPPSRRDRYEMDLWGGGSGEPFPRERERFPPPSSHAPARREESSLTSLLPTPSERRGPEMEIIVVNSQQKEYSQMVRQQVESIGIMVEMRQLSPTFSLLEALDSAAKRGFLYTIIITSQHEAHRSVTLTILHGRNPQEHKNMPLGDAIGLIERDYDRYCHTVRTTGGRPLAGGTSSLGLGGSSSSSGGLGSGDSISSLMTKAAAGGSLSSEELTSLISSLQQKQNSMESRASSAATAEDIQQQQADLQAKILSLLGSSAVVPPTKPAMPTAQPARRFGGGGGMDQGFGGGGFNGFQGGQSQYGGYR